MQLIDIDPQRYRQRLTKIMFACIGLLSISSLSISQLFITLFPSANGTHFHWNLLGVVLSALLLLFILIKLKSHSFFYEANYVWSLKQTLNKINRRMKEIEQAVQRGEPNAIQILHYSYVGSRQLWQLDNNTITLNRLTSLEKQLAEKAKQHQVILDIEQFNDTLLLEY